jgi:hypothetical protein
MYKNVSSILSYSYVWEQTRTQFSLYCPSEQGTYICKSTFTRFLKSTNKNYTIFINEFFQHFSAVTGTFLYTKNNIILLFGMYST